MSLKTYRAISAFAQGNTRYDRGVILSLTDKQATYLLTGGFIELVPVEASPESAAANDGDADAKNPADSADGKKGGKGEKSDKGGKA